MSLLDVRATVECDGCYDTVEVEMALLAGGDGAFVDDEVLKEQGAEGWVEDEGLHFCPECVARTEK